MQQYNIEIFDPSFTFKQNYVVDDIEYSFDYMSITENTVIVPFDENVAKGDYIRIKNDERTFCGVITSLSVDASVEGFTNLGFKPLMSLFDVSIVFTVSDQGYDTLEQTLANYVTSTFINNSDTSQNISGLTVSTVSTTSSWTYYIVSDIDGGDVAIVNLLELFQLALTKYGVVLQIVPNFEAKTITCSIGTLSIGTFVIEADLPNVFDKNIIFNQNLSDVNKLIVLDSTDYTNSVTYYLHSDDTYDTTDSDRITPVIYSVATASATNTKTFAEVAADLADDQFGNANKANNLIELWISKEDTMVKPEDMEVGQWVTVIANGTSYESMFTGYEIGELIKLTFGTVRLDLTKILKRRL